MFSHSGVSSVDGSTVQTETPRTPSTRSSWRRLAPRERTAALDMQYGALLGWAISPSTEETLTSTPEPCARM